MRVSRLGAVWLFVAAMLVPSIAMAEGNLYLESYRSLHDTGVANANLYLYDDQGSMIHSGHGAGSYEAGTLVPVEEGWYWVEVGTTRSEHNLQRLFVDDGRTTVVPSGWVALTTTAPSEQPRRGCNGWNAELTAFVLDDEENEHLIMSNRGSGVFDYGLIQLPVGEVVVYFNSMPIRLEVVANEVYHIPTGYQDPVSGDRAQIALRGERAPNNVMLSLCQDGSLHLPAGDYWVTRIVATNHYPYEERVWDRVAVEVRNRMVGYTSVEGDSVRHLYRGEGSQPSAVESEIFADALSNYRRGQISGGVQTGFGAVLPSLSL